jgi:transposase
MIQITPQMRILVAIEPLDFRNGIDGLSRVCREVLKRDPFSGCLFVFRNRRGTAIKTLAYDGQGYWLCQKRLSKGRFRWWPKEGEGNLKHLLAHELQLLIWNGSPAARAVPPMWKKVLC